MRLSFRSKITHFWPPGSQRWCLTGKIFSRFSMSSVSPFIGRQGGGVFPPPDRRTSIKIGCRLKKKVVFLVEDHRIGGPLPPPTLPPKFSFDTKIFLFH